VNSGVKFTVRQYDEIVLSLDPTRFDTEEEVIKAFRIQKHPDEEFTAKIEDSKSVKFHHIK